MPSSPHNPAQQPTISSQTILIIGTITYLISQTYPILIIALSIILSFAIPYAFRVNDDPTSRRRLWNEFAKDKDRPQDWKDLDKSVDVMERYWVNSRGMCLCTSLLLPKNTNSTPIRAVACFCHGYMDNASFLKRIEYSRFVKKGIAVVTIEYEGHGRSDGTLGLVPDFYKLIDDTSEFFKEVIEERFEDKPCFLVGESMGGAVAYHTYHRHPSLYSGIIFSAPMLKISSQMKPPEFISTIFKFLAGSNGTCTWIGSLPITPAKNVQLLSFKLAARRMLASSAPMHYGRKPRLSTARELVSVAEEISKEECSSRGCFDAPFLIMHGRDDKVTCPELSQLFYDVSRSKDKEIKIYDGMYHTLTSGEPPENIDIVFNDAISWILARV